MEMKSGGGGFIDRYRKGVGVGKRSALVDFEKEK